MPNFEENGVTYIGKCNFRGNERVFGIKKTDRRQHMYVIGKTGVGKSALLKNMALQDIRAGRGIGIVDPHGEFVEEVLAQIPAERIADVVYFNPVDADYPIGFNILEVPDVKYKHLVVSDLLGIFTKIWANVWSARMEYILQNCILALIDTPGTTLLGIPRILVEKEYRDKIVANVTDPVVRSFWTQEYETWRDQFRNEAIVPIQNKVGQFLNTSFVRNIVGQPTSTLNIPDVMNSGKILLVNVSKGRIGEDNAALLGAMIITKIQLAAMERVRIPEEQRLDFYLYVDEFQNFATDSFAAILSEARKYRLNLFIAHQYVGQLVTDVSTKVRDAVFGNVGTMISFRVGATDAEFLENEFTPEFLMADLTNLPNYHIYLKLMVDGVTSRPFSAGTLPPLKYDMEPGTRERIIEASRARYGRSREEVEQQITEWSGNVRVGGREVPRGGPFSPPAPRGGNVAPPSRGNFTPPMERSMPSVQKPRYGSSLAEMGIEFKSNKPIEQKPPLPAMERKESMSPMPERGESPERTERPAVPGQGLSDSGMRPAPLERSLPTSVLRPAPSGQGSPNAVGRPEVRTDRGQRPFDNRPAGQNNQRQMQGPGERQLRQDLPRTSIQNPAVLPQDRDSQVSSRSLIPDGKMRDESPRAQHEARHTPKAPAVQEDRSRIQNAPPAAGLRTQSVVRLPTGGAKISLQSLKSSEKEKDEPPADVPTIREMKQQHTVSESRKEVNTADLRSILNQVMSEKKPDTTPTEAKKPVNVPEGNKKFADHHSKQVSDKETSSGSILKPGDTVKF